MVLLTGTGKKCPSLSALASTLGLGNNVYEASKWSPCSSSSGATGIISESQTLSCHSTEQMPSTIPHSLQETHSPLLHNPPHLSSFHFLPCSMPHLLIPSRTLCCLRASPFWKGLPHSRSLSSFRKFNITGHLSS